jgi:hypothetical protein
MRPWCCLLICLLICAGFWSIVGLAICHAVK